MSRDDTNKRQTVEEAREVFALLLEETSHIGPKGPIPGPDPKRRTYRSLALFSDPDGNRWVLQEMMFLRAHGDTGAISFSSAIDLASPRVPAIKMKPALARHTKSGRTDTPSIWSAGAPACEPRPNQTVTLRRVRAENN